MSLPIPYDQHVASVHGAGTGVAIALPSMVSTDTIVAVVQHERAAAGTSIVGLDPGAFTAANGSMSSASVSTADKIVCVVFVR
jgi:hypothetical protein